MLHKIAADIWFHDEWVTVHFPFMKLCEFVCGLAYTCLGTTQFECDFSVIGWEKNEYRSAVKDFALEEIKHAKQLKGLQASWLVSREWLLWFK